MQPSSEPRALSGSPPVPVLTILQSLEVLPHPACLPPHCFSHPLMPPSAQHRLKVAPAPPSSLLPLNYLTYPHCIFQSCFAVFLLFYGCIILLYNQHKSILIDLVCFEHFLCTKPSNSSFISFSQINRDLASLSQIYARDLKFL